MASGFRTRRLFLVLSLHFFALTLPSPSFARTFYSSQPAGNTVYYNLTITYGLWAPDCVTKQIYLINGQHPGPEIRAKEGDTLVVRVRNELDVEGVSIHWHGVRQLNTNLMDGTAFVTQCPITPMDYMDYKFTVDKAGTYFYHGHLGNQVSGGFYGALIVDPVKPPPFSYDGEFSLLLNDWFHRSVYEQTVGYDAKAFVWIGDPQSLLLNGRGQYNCSLVPTGPPSPPFQSPDVVGDVKTCDASNPQCAARTTFSVERGKTYRLRIINVASVMSFNLALQGHDLNVVVADSYELQPFLLPSATGVDVYAGETVDVLFTANQPSSTYWIRSGIMSFPSNTPVGLGILHYSDVASPADPTSPPPPVRPWTDYAASIALIQKYKGHSSVPKVPKKASRTVVLVGAVQLVQGNVREAMNNISLKLPSIPYVFGVPAKVDYGPTPPDNEPSPWDYTKPAPSDAVYGSGYYRFSFGQTVDIVLQNTLNPAAGYSEFHPFHMHGHHFWILGYGNGTYNQTLHSKSYNLVDPPYRFTVPLIPDGWVAVRIKANNQGVWMFHCHIQPHLHLGMAIVFVTGSPRTPKASYPRCGFH